LHKNSLLNNLVTEKEIVSQIYFIRGRKVMLDFHIATLYQVETRALKQQVKRNINRFPEDFMFQLTEMEWREVITNCDNLGGAKFSPATPFAFTEQGVAMLSGILKSEKAVAVNIAVMRAFVKMRELLDDNKVIKAKIDDLETKYDHQFKIVFDALRELIIEKNEPRIPIGFRVSDNK